MWTYVRTVTHSSYFADIFCLLLAVSLINYPNTYGLIYQLLYGQNNLSHIFNFTSQHHSLNVIFTLVGNKLRILGVSSIGKLTLWEGNFGSTCPMPLQILYGAFLFSGIVYNFVRIRKERGLQVSINCFPYITNLCLVIFICPRNKSVHTTSNNLYCQTFRSYDLP